MADADCNMLELEIDDESLIIWETEVDVDWISAKTWTGVGKEYITYPPWSL
jgi:hypothetical protein